MNIALDSGERESFPVVEIRTPVFPYTYSEMLQGNGLGGCKVRERSAARLVVAHPCSKMKSVFRLSTLILG